MEATSKNLDGYGAPPINPDGAPHVVGVGIAQIDGIWYFTSGPAARKTRNIAAGPYGATKFEVAL